MRPLTPCNQVLRDARALLLHYGWTQHLSKSYGRPEGEWGALDLVEAVVRAGATTKAGGEAMRVLAELVGGTTSRDICEWEYPRGRTIDDVLGLIDRALT